MYIYYKYTVVVSVYKTDSNNLHFKLVTVLFDCDTNWTIEMTYQTFLWWGEQKQTENPRFSKIYLNKAASCK